MAYSIATLKDDLEGMMHGTTLDQITNLNGVINRAARQLLEDVDPQETKRTTQFVNPIYSNVFDYAVPTDLKGNKVIDIKPQVNRQPNDRYPQTYNQNFDLLKSWDLSSASTIKFNNGIKTIGISNPFNNLAVILNQADTPTDNGTWTAFGSASDLQTDYVNYASGSSSLEFSLAAAGATGGLVNSTITNMDISNTEGQGAFFLYVYLPSASVFTNVIFKIGSSASDYWTGTITTTQSGTAFVNGWNLLQLNWANATVVGTPDSSDITYIQVTYTYDGTLQAGVHLDNIVYNLGTILEIEYYSKYIFRNSSTGAFQETVLDDDDLINLDTESYNLMTFLVALYATQQQSGAEGVFDYNFFKEQYLVALSRYKAMYKSEIQKPQLLYYKKPNPSMRQWYGGRLGY